MAREEVEGAGEMEGVVVVTGVTAPTPPVERGEEIAVIEEPRLVPRDDVDEDGGVDTAAVVVPSEERIEATEVPATEGSGKWNVKTTIGNNWLGFRQRDYMLS